MKKSDVKFCRYTLIMKLQVNSVIRQNVAKFAYASNSVGKSWILTFLILALFNQTQFKPLVLAILISPGKRGGSTAERTLLFSRNLIAFTGILWAIHSLFGYAKIESLKNDLILILIQVAAIQIIRLWKPVQNDQEDSGVEKARARILFLIILTSIYLFSVLDFPHRLSTFLLGWDHLNGHIWLTSQIHGEGYIRINAQDAIGIYPKAQFPLILSFSNEPIGFQSLVQGIIFVEILLAVSILCILHDLLFRNKQNGKIDRIVQYTATISASPILVLFILYGWTSLLLTTCSLLVLTWQLVHKQSNQNRIIIFLAALAAFQSWTLIAPVILIILLFSKMREIDKWYIFFTFIFVAINIPSVLAILQFSGLDQVSQGFESKSISFLLVFLGAGLPISYLMFGVSMQLSVKLLVLATYLEAFFIWLGTGPGLELPYYAVKIFLITILFLTPLMISLVFSKIKIPNTKLPAAVLLLIVLFVYGKVPASSYSYLNVIQGRDLQTNWLSENIIQQLSQKNSMNIILNSVNVINVGALSDIGKIKNQDLFAFDSKYICDVRKSGGEYLVLSDSAAITTKCN
jgi:hypothetical protein